MKSRRYFEEVKTKKSYNVHDMQAIINRNLSSSVTWKKAKGLLYRPRWFVLYINNFQRVSYSRNKRKVKFTPSRTDDACLCTQNKSSRSKNNSGKDFWEIIFGKGFQAKD